MSRIQNLPFYNVALCLKRIHDVPEGGPHLAHVRCMSDECHNRWKAAPDMQHSHASETHLTCDP